MSKRLQVVLDEAQYRDLRRMARKHGMTVSQLVRRALSEMDRREPVKETGPKLIAVREAAKHAYPTAEIGQMLAEIERGYALDDE